MEEKQNEDIYALVENCVKHKDFTPQELQIVKRIINKTADFDYADTLKFSPDAVKLALLALEEGTNIVTDSKMTNAGINKRLLEHLRVSSGSFTTDDEDSAKALQGGSVTALDLALADPQNRIFIFSNTPASLLYFLDKVKDRCESQCVVIAAPVGFVGVTESLEMLKQSDLPYILIDGPKGGNVVAAEIVNTLLFLAYYNSEKQEDQIQTEN